MVLLIVKRSRHGYRSQQKTDCRDCSAKGARTSMSQKPSEHFIECLDILEDLANLSAVLESTTEDIKATFWRMQNRLQSGTKLRCMAHHS